MEKDSQGSNPSLHCQNAPSIHNGKQNNPRMKQILSGGHLHGSSGLIPMCSDLSIRGAPFRSRCCSHTTSVAGTIVAGIQYAPWRIDQWTLANAIYAHAPACPSWPR